MTTATAKPKPVKGGNPFDATVLPEGCYPPAVCRRLDYLLARKKEAKAKRTELFKARDGLNAEIDTLRAPEKEKRQRLQSELGDAVRQIERLQKTIGWAESCIEETIANARQGDMFGVDEKPEPPADLFTHKAPEDKQGADLIVPPEESDQHLTASVNELDIPEQLKGKIIAAGIETVGRLTMYVDRDTDLAGLLNVGENKVSQIKQALKAYRKAHRAAMTEAEQRGRDAGAL